MGNNKSPHFTSLHQSSKTGTILSCTEYRYVTSFLADELHNERTYDLTNIIYLFISLIITLSYKSKSMYTVLTICNFLIEGYTVLLHDAE